MLLLLIVIIHCKVFEIARVTLMRLCFWGRLISGQCFYTLALFKHNSTGFSASIIINSSGRVSRENFLLALSLCQRVCCLC